jgi:hypothetical protein
VGVGSLFGFQVNQGGGEHQSTWLGHTTRTHKHSFYTKTGTELVAIMNHHEKNLAAFEPYQHFVHLPW